MELVRYSEIDYGDVIRLKLSVDGFVTTSRYISLYLMLRKHHIIEA